MAGLRQRCVLLSSLQELTTKPHLQSRYLKVILNLVVGDARGGRGGRRMWNIVRTFATVILGEIMIPATLLPPAFPRKKK